MSEELLKPVEVAERWGVSRSWVFRAAEEGRIPHLDTEQLRRGDVFESRERVCRIGRALAVRLAPFGPALSAAVAPHAELLARTILGAPNHVTPLTRRRHRASVGL